MMRVALLLAFALMSTGASAQPDPMEEQRCIWRCLANSRGASDPAYNACVRNQCMGPPASGKSSAAPRPAPSPAAPAPRGPVWRTVSDLSYPAVAQCVAVGSNSQLCLAVACPARGGLSLEIYGLEPGLAGAPLRVETASAQFALTLPPRAPEEEAFRLPMPPGLAAALKTGSEVRVAVNELGFRLSLAGSGSAITEVEARCR